MTLTDPYPADLAEIEDTALGFADPEAKRFVNSGPPNELVTQADGIKALQRIAAALERLAASGPQPVQNGPGLAALPPVRPVAPVAQNGGACPIHNVPWKTVPAGISKKTGAEYSAFQACSIAGCNQRPPR